MRKMTTYSWQGWRQECPPAANGGHSTREVARVPSKAALYRLMPDSKPSDFFNLHETHSRAELELVEFTPNIILWRPLDHRGPGGWHVAKETPVTLRAHEDAEGCGR